ncbi:alpha-amylase [Phlyctema vagabunda]|uniref:alpha-amylase n=1 Tax=Phlyctema vagabunda TaxID=108571 RepID=A0ABR4PDJ4_9HELO
MKLFSLAALSLVCSTVSGLTPAQWRGQSIYQVVTDRFARTDGSVTASCNVNSYCGGTWQGIIKHLDYIQGMGFTAIWISPVTQQITGDSSDGQSYHGYWQNDLYKLNSNFGTADDLKQLSKAIHDRGMYLMVDIVTNHMAYLGCGSCVDYSTLKPFNSKSYYHDFCLINYNDATSIKNCWMGDNIVALPDLRTEDSSVSSMLNSWVKGLVTNYTIDGLRLDSAQQVSTASLKPLEAAAGVYVIGEIFNGAPDYTCPYQQSLSGVLNFPSYYWITEAFQTTSGSISNLANGINTLKSTCKDVTIMGSFLENHDVKRFPYTTSDLSLTKNAIAFTILQDGIPIVYYGQEQQFKGGDVPYDREALWTSGYSTTSTLYKFIGAINQIRNQALFKDPTYLTYNAYPVYSDTSTIVMRKGYTGAQIISVFSNRGASGASYTLSLTSSQTGFTANQALVEILGCTSYTTDSSGNLAVAMAGGAPRIFYPAAQLTGSAVCSTLTSK